MRRLMMMAAAVASLITGAASAAEDGRVALIIGNDSYRSLKKLDNGANDARAMASELKAMGFETILKVNAGRKEMHAAIGEFGGKLSSGAVGLFYYAGHGIQAGDHNYLVPVDAELVSEDDLVADAIDASRVLQAMESAKNRLNIVVLDACRDNPLPKASRSGARGLAVMPAPTGTFVAYATGPGQVAQDGDRGGNGVFTGELVKALKEPGLKIEDVFKKTASGVRERTGGKQVPWTQASIQGDFYFRAPSAWVEPAAVVTQPPAVVSTVDSTAVEMTFWQSAEKSGSLSAYQAYAKKFPQGQFIDLAKVKIEDLRKSQQASIAAQPPAAVAQPVAKPASELAEIRAAAQRGRENALAAQRQALDAQRRGQQVGAQVANGAGQIIWPEGHRYEGESRDGKLDGFGVLTLSSGQRYEGEFRGGKRNGFGVNSFPNGRRHEGEYRDDKRNGYGILTGSDGERYEGMYRDDARNGRGIFTKPDGSVQAGLWNNDNLDQPLANMAGGR